MTKQLIFIGLLLLHITAFSRQTRPDTDTSWNSGQQEILPEQPPVQQFSPEQSPDAGSFTPDAGSFTPDTGSFTPDAGSLTADQQLGALLLDALGAGKSTVSQALSLPATNRQSATNRRYSVHTSSPGHINLPLQNGRICYEYISPMDSSLSKEILYRNAMNWYMRSFPYAYKNLIVSDQYHGKIYGRCNFQFTYNWLMDDYLMKVDFAVEISVRYGKCRLRLFQIQPKDEIKGEESYSGKKGYSTWEDRSLERMNVQYLATSRPPAFERDKITGIDTYFRSKLLSFKQSQHDLKGMASSRDRF